MSLKFVIIPIDPRCEEYAREIKSEINNAVSCDVFIDTDYNTSLSKKLITHKKNGNDSITITADNAVNKELTVRYADNRSRAEFLTLDIFIELIKSYCDAETNDKNENENEDKKIDNSSKDGDSKEEVEERGGCVVM
jgi:threonyl-tRNA synthetase